MNYFLDGRFEKCRSTRKYSSSIKLTTKHRKYSGNGTISSTEYTFIKTGNYQVSFKLFETIISIMIVLSYQKR